MLHYGQLIGAVLADTREIASKAAKLVNVDYEDLEAIYTIDVRTTFNGLHRLKQTKIVDKSNYRYNLYHR